MLTVQLIAGSVTLAVMCTITAGELALTTVSGVNTPRTISNTRMVTVAVLIFAFLSENRFKTFVTDLERTRSEVLNVSPEIKLLN